MKTKGEVQHKINYFAEEIFGFPVRGLTLRETPTFKLIKSLHRVMVLKTNITARRLISIV